MIKIYHLGTRRGFTFAIFSGALMFNVFGTPEAQIIPTALAAPMDQSSCALQLELLGLGVTYEKFRQGMLLRALDGGSAFSSIRETDPAKYEWSADDKEGQSGGRALDALENGGARTPMYWAVPSLFAGIPDYRAVKVDTPIIGLVSNAETNGMAWHLFVAAGGEASERPDHVLAQAFAFFEAHPDVPLIFVSSIDTTGARDRRRAPGSLPLLRDGRYLPERPDSAVVLVLACRERVERLRAFAWDDRENDFGQNKLRMGYYELKDSLPRQRVPTLEEWSAHTSRLLQRDDIRYGWDRRLAEKWKPTPWFPVPWSRQQLAAFDSLPTLGYIHRPVFVKTTDDKGQPLPPGKRRDEALQRGWKRALIGAGEKSEAPVPQRLIAATGGNTDQALSLHAMLRAYSAEGGPTYDIADGKRFIDTERRLGNTGAATFFMQAAIGVMAAYKDGGVSAAINLRDTSEASIVLITPPSDELRRTQQHPKGGDVFRHSVMPEYDPAVYK